LIRHCQDNISDSKFIISGINAFVYIWDIKYRLYILTFVLFKNILSEKI